MALVNAFSSLSLAAPKAAGLGFKKAVAAFAQPAARVSGARVAFAVEAKQNKKARVIQVRSARRNALAELERTSRARGFVYTRVHARERNSTRAVCVASLRTRALAGPCTKTLTRLFSSAAFLREDRR